MDTLPLYGIDERSAAEAPQCSSCGEFCFLCTFEGATEGNDEDIYTTITDLVNHMAQQKKEFVTIVRAVAQQYQQKIRPHVHFTHPETGQKVDKPEWTRSSIRRHLLFSGQFPQLFNEIVRHMLRGLVYRHNATLIDAHTGDPIEEKRKALMDTLQAVRHWDNHTLSAEEPQKKQRKRKAEP